MSVADPVNPITGYRTLSEAEVTAINAVKKQAETIKALLATVAATPGVDQRWVSIAQTDLQKGFMALTRAIAQPSTF
jgi:hypothetical protein